MIKFSKEEILFIIAAFFFGLTIMLIIFQILFTQRLSQKIVPIQKPQQLWQIESVDTMKFSRDAAGQGINDSYVTMINKQIAQIASLGANYVAIDTPYDTAFLPVLRQWVKSARAAGLHVWFRGNFSGWEGWFNYPQISEQDHIKMSRQFILDNPDLFQDGDIFTSCPECENGIHLNIGDPQVIASYRQFLISEYISDNQAFATIDKKVNNGYFSMNADVAHAVMNRETTQELGGIVVIDHYVKTPVELVNGVESIAAESGGKVVLGEFGAPIPDINGTMTDEQQKVWLQQSLKMLTGVDALMGVNYWVSVGGSTALWNDDGSPRSAVSVISQYYHNGY